MQVYHYVPYPRILFLAFTILFHIYLLIRSATGGRYIMASTLLVPVIGVSAALIKFLKKSLITINIDNSKVELLTFYERFSSNISDLSIRGKTVMVSGKEFVINPSKAAMLMEAIGHKN